MAQNTALKVIKHTTDSDILPLGETRSFYLTMRQALLQQVAAIEKLLGIRRRCKHCGEDQ